MKNSSIGNLEAGKIEGRVVYSADSFGESLLSRVSGYRPYARMYVSVRPLRCLSVLIYWECVQGYACARGRYIPSEFSRQCLAPTAVRRESPRGARVSTAA